MCLQHIKSLHFIISFNKIIILRPNCGSERETICMMYIFLCILEHVSYPISYFHLFLQLGTLISVKDDE
jgi:hypothetical protein